ncbi:TonB-dependent receptor domain-containing protein [Psychrosphaera haliotis]|uniref:TonB-dependent receptor n=1 Tax=Psychrosphaera haliotis TaxID=555083 RepID=A0A6N8F8F4_9GAMM|nr:TonB-dependent receptor [Psychrosphaera haliotis]MUH72693.1 TonB-dependent receptor [Psychrosphaera haliotis]
MRKKKIHLLVSSILSGAAVFSLPLLAADEAPEKADQQLESIEKITVTGSRIRRAELDQNTPVFTFGAEDMTVRGFTNAADLLNQSPLFGGSQSPLGAQNGFNAGQNQVNLFDLGTQRTLTLVNGRRLVTSQSAVAGGSQVDLNVIPAALIERIETVPLTGAATYGADAIAGTVNVILKDDYEGLEVTGQYGDNEDGNAASRQFSILGGGNFDDNRGNITFGMEYTKDDGLLECDQDFLCNNNPDFDNAQSEYVDLNGDGQADDLNGDGVVDADDKQSVSLVRDEIRLALFTENGAVTPGGGFLPGFGLGAFPNGKFYGFTPDGSLEECAPGAPNTRTIMTSGSDVCGTDFFDAVSQIRSPVSRFNTYASLNYDLTDDISLKTDFIYANTKGEELVNQGGFQTSFFGGTSAAISLRTDNPFLSTQARQTLRSAGLEGKTFGVHRFNNDLLRNGANSNETQVWRVSNVLEGAFDALDREFYWDVSVVHGRSDIQVETSGIVDGRFLNAVDARRVDDALLEQVRLQNPDDATDDLPDLDAALAALQGSNGGFTANFDRGDTICGAYADLAAGTLTGFNDRARGSGLVDEDLPFLDGCVPLSLFGKTASDEALDFITGGTQIAASDNSQTVFSANIGSYIAELPAGYLDFVVGMERRVEKGNYDPSVGLRVPITRSSISRPVKGGFDTEEYYFEMVAPIISEDMDIPFVQSFEVSGAYRYQEFNTQAPSGFEDKTTDADVYQASMKWQVYNDLAFRGTYATAFRNPSINELFLPASQTFISGADPCDSRSVGLGPNPSVRKANCEAIGIDTDTFVSSIQDGTISGGIASGNPELEPETNKSHSFGLMYTPEFLEGFRLAVDYYNLEIEDSISDVDFPTQAATCFDSNDFPNEAACSSFVRDADNQVVSAKEQPANVALSTFESVTIRAFYDFDLAEFGNLSVDAFTQHNISNEFQATAASEVTEDVGDFADPDWLGTLDLTWTKEAWLVSHRVRWQSSVKIDSLEQRLYASDYTQNDDGIYTGNFTNESDARFINDLSVRYSFDDSASVQVNISNLLDRRPDENGRIAFAAGHFGVDERLGRRFSVRFNKKF